MVDVARDAFSTVKPDATLMASVGDQEVNPSHPGIPPRVHNLGETANKKVRQKRHSRSGTIKSAGGRSRGKEDPANFRVISIFVMGLMDAFSWATRRRRRADGCQHFSRTDCTNRSSRSTSSGYPGGLGTLRDSDLRQRPFPPSPHVSRRHSLLDLSQAQSGTLARSIPKLARSSSFRQVS